MLLIIANYRDNQNDVNEKSKQKTFYRVLTVNFEHISHLFLGYFLLPLNIQILVGCLIYKQWIISIIYRQRIFCFNDNMFLFMNLLSARCEEGCRTRCTQSEVSDMKVIKFTTNVSFEMCVFWSHMLYHVIFI